MTLAGKIAVVTGGGTGVGEAIALDLANNGCQVVIGGRRLEKLQEVAKAASGSATIQCHQLDVGDKESVKTFFDWVKANVGQVDILVQSAGINIPNRSMAVTSAEDWDKVLQINASGAFYCLQNVIPGMRDRGDGLIINISSVAGKRGSALGGVAYAASKFAMTGLGMTVGSEERENGIRVTNVYPGEVETPILDNRPAPVSAERRAKMLQPEDIAALITQIAKLPARAHVPEIIIKPTVQDYV